MNIKKNDTVLIIAGKDNGKTGKVLSVFPKTGKITVDGINVQKKHRKPRSANEVGGITSQSGAFDASNAMVVCPSCNKATRVAHKIEADKKIRVCKKCGASLDKAVIKETADDKKKKKAAKKDVAEKPEALEEVKEEKAKKAPAKKTAEKKTDKEPTAEKAAKKTVKKQAEKTDESSDA